MRKRIIEPVRDAVALQDEEWLNLESLAEVEITSENPANPIEHALLPSQGGGWVASDPGVQTIRIIFAHPQSLKRIRLCFMDDHNERTQEYVLRWSPDGGKSIREILRQQWTFSPHGATTEVETHQVNLSAVTVLELTIIPDIGGKPVCASLHALRVA